MSEKLTMRLYNAQQGHTELMRGWQWAKHQGQRRIHGGALCQPPCRSRSGQGNEPKPARCRLASSVCGHRSRAGETGPMAGWRGSTGFTGGNMSSKDEDRKAVEQAQLLKRALEEIGTPAYFERLAFIATDRIHRYKAHIAAGFSEQQALELCK